ncbi:hypothetical protein BH10PSE7_BH10PSE7_29610 [soil metagenome]
MISLMKGERGFVLISVIWIVGLLAVVATVFTLTVRAHIRSASNRTETVRLEAAADGVARLVAFALSRRGDGRLVIARDGSAFACDFGSAMTASIHVQDQGGLVDLNRAPPLLFETLMRGLGAAPGDAKRLAAALADFRDPDSIAYGIEGGAEVNLVVKGPGIKNSAFQSVDEIDQAIPVGGVDRMRLAPFLTVHSAEQGFDPAFAPAPLRAMIDKRDIEMFAVPSAQRVFSVDVTVRGGRTAFRRLAIVSLTGEAGRPFAVLEWRQSEPGGMDAAETRAAKPCAALAATQSSG